MTSDRHVPQPPTHRPSKPPLVTHVLVGSFALAGCIDMEGGLEEPNDVLKPPPPGEEEQGRYLLGNLADALAADGRHFSVAPAAINVPGVTIAMSGASLIARDATGATLPASALVGLVLANPAGGELQIASVTGGFQLVVRASPSAAWVDYCDPAIASVALPMQGEWTVGGEHDHGPMISWACQHSGVAAKCISWGYAPLDLGPGTSEWDHHQACTQMARADYCADGVTHTREETPIWIRDFITGAMPDNVSPHELEHPASWPAPPNQFYFEAAWAPREAVLCLSKLRWASLPIDGLCSSIVPDPRVDPAAKYCEDYSVAELQAKGANVLNGSKTMELMMHRWVNVATGDTLTTGRGFASQVAGETIAPFPGYVYQAPDGILLRNLPGSIEPGEVTRRYLQTKANDRVVAADVPLAGYTLDSFEGYTLNAAGAGRVALTLYRKGSDYISAIAPPGGGFVPVQPLGYVTAP